MSTSIEMVVKRLLEPPFGTETSERLLMGTAADAIRHLQGELAEAELKAAHLAKQEVDIRAAYELRRASEAELARENKRLDREWEAAEARADREKARADELAVLNDAMRENDGEIAASIERAGIVPGTWIVHALDAVVERSDGWAAKCAELEAALTACRQDTAKLIAEAVAAERAKVAGLSEALSPFAQAASFYEGGMWGDTIIEHNNITVGDLRRAVSAMNRARTTGGSDHGE